VKCGQVTCKLAIFNDCNLVSRRSSVCGGSGVARELTKHAQGVRHLGRTGVVAHLEGGEREAV
jgi:hypothetical protein